MSYDFKNGNTGDRRGGLPGIDQQQAQRFGLALSAPILRRILEAILPIKMGPVKEASGYMATSTGSAATVARRETTPRSTGIHNGSRPPRDTFDFLEGKVPFRVRSDLKVEGDNIVRFDIHQRIQHVLMFTSFLTLAFTGLPQKTHDFSGSQWLIAALGGLEQVQTIHHIAGLVMLFDCLYHLIYVVLGVVFFKKLAPLQMIPTPKDIKDAVQQFSYFLGLTAKPPKFGRYSYLEKFDYWAVFWGIFVIGGSGLILMFPVLATKVLPGQIIPVALVAHSDEALLAVGWIFVVHFFYAHFVPHIFPFNPSIFTGRVPKHRYAEEHPLDWERMEWELNQKQTTGAGQKEKVKVAGTPTSQMESRSARIIKLVSDPTGGATLTVEELEHKDEKKN